MNNFRLQYNIDRLDHFLTEKIENVFTFHEKKYIVKKKSGQEGYIEKIQTMKVE